MFLKSEKLQGKLEARYQGPYKIHSQTKNKNYYLENTKGIKLKNSYPLSRLKVVADTVNDDESQFEIEKILNERINKGIREYLVKWKNYPESDNSWVKESNMNAPELIEEFKIENNSKSKVEINNISSEENIRKKINKYLIIVIVLYFIFLKQ